MLTLPGHKVNPWLCLSWSLQGATETGGGMGLWLLLWPLGDEIALT